MRAQRCNRGNGTMNCVLINYPAAEKRQWDDKVTRISHTLKLARREVSTARVTGF